MLLCLAIVHAGIAHSLPNLMFQAQDAALPNVPFQENYNKDTAPRALTQTLCSSEDKFYYLVSLGIECVVNFGTIINPFATEPEKADAVNEFCTNLNCDEPLVTFLESTCNVQEAADEIKAICATS